MSQRQVCGLFLKRGNHATATIPRNIHLHKMFSKCRSAISNIIDNNIVLSTEAANEVIDSMIAKSCTGQHCEKILRR